MGGMDGRASGSRERNFLLVPLLAAGVKPRVKQGEAASLPTAALYLSHVDVSSELVLVLVSS